MKEKIIRYSESLEDYLEMIFVLGGEQVRSVDIATQMHVSKASVNRAVNNLMEKGLVSKAPYGDISLTAIGKATSERVLKKHLVIRKFLTEVLGVSEEAANEEACGIEHIISEETFAKLEKMVDDQPK